MHDQSNIYEYGMFPSLSDMPYSSTIKKETRKENGYGTHVFTTFSYCKNISNLGCRFPIIPFLYILAMTLGLQKMRDTIREKKYVESIKYEPRQWDSKNIARQWWTENYDCLKQITKIIIFIRRQLAATYPTS